MLLRKMFPLLYFVAPECYLERCCLYCILLPQNVQAQGRNQLTITGWLELPARGCVHTKIAVGKKQTFILAF